jgi:hypothetical protein
VELIEQDRDLSEIASLDKQMDDDPDFTTIDEGVTVVTEDGSPIAVS